MTALGVLLVLLIPPGLAVREMAAVVEWRIIAGYCALVLVTTFLCYRHDKRQAEAGGWRTPEATLHFWEFVGGWPAAFVAQRVFRHKIAKRGYQIGFWAIVLSHEYLAIDFLQSWRWLQQGLRLFS